VGAVQAGDPKDRWNPYGCLKKSPEPYYLDVAQCDLKMFSNSILGYPTLLPASSLVSNAEAYSYTVCTFFYFVTFY